MTALAESRAARANAVARRLRPRRAPSANLIAALVCAALGVVSVLSLPSVPGYDPFGWIVWGHEIAHHVIGPHEPFITRGGPAWKPLPVVFTTIFGFFGASVKLWMALSRAAGLFGVFTAYRAAAALAGPDRWRLAGPVAGVLAALGVLLTAKWAFYMYRGTSEPLVIAATLYAIERHLAGRRLTAFSAGVALALMRPESTPFVVLYAAWCAVTMPGIWRRVALVVGLALIPLAWTVPTAIAAGDLLSASDQVRTHHGALGVHLVLAQELKRASGVTVWPVIIAGGAGTLLALRNRDQRILRLAAGMLAYVAVVIAMTVAHYPGQERFMLPAAAVAALLAGVAVARVAALAGVAVTRLRTPIAGASASTVIAAGLVAVAVPFFTGGVRAADQEYGRARQAVGIDEAMVTASRRAGGMTDILPCSTSRAAINHTLQTSLAWTLGVPLTRVLAVNRSAHSLNHTALAFYAPADSITGGRPGHPAAGLRQDLAARSGRWQIDRITRPRHPRVDGCVGR